jgi:methyl-accepting chemotaxis protein
VSKNSHQAAEAARIAADTAHDGGKVVSETLANMRLIADSTNAVSAKISELGRSSDQIGSIASVISDIAGQTNLLALNAAIEAARAGEQGRGFAVVAGEVRRLAERTATATEEISGMIDSIQREAREAVEAMQGESRQVMLGVDKTESSGKALDRIIEMAGQVGEMVAQIATAATQQSAAAEEVNGNVAHIAKMTSESSENASETSRACTNLSSLALSLQSVVGQFKLSSTA